MRDGWVETTLEDIADVIDPHPSHRAPSVDENGIPFIGIGDLRNTGDIDFSKARRVSREILEEHKARYSRSDYLVGLGRVASIGMVVRLPNESVDYVVSPTLAVLKAKNVLGPFLFYLLQGDSSQAQFQKFKKGSTRESVGMQILRKIKVNVPPLPEQKRIVDLISSVDSYIDALQQQVVSARRSRNAVLHELLESVPQTLRRPLIDLAKLQRGHDLPSQDRADGKIPVIASNGVVGYHNQFKAHGPGVITGRSGTIGKVIFINEDYWPLNTTLYVVDFKGNDPRFVSLVLGEMHLENYAGGSTVPSLDRNVLSQVQVPSPDIHEQNRIVDIVSDLDNFIVSVQATTDQAKDLRSGLLSDLLSGNHEIPATYDKIMGAA